MKQTAWIFGAGCLAGFLAIAFFVMQAATRANMADGHARAEATLGLTLQAMEGHLGRYESIPDLLADNDAVRAALDTPTDPATVIALNRWLDQKNEQLDSLDIYVMTPDGTTIAASNHDQTTSFIGQNFSYRPYFQQAVSGGKGRFYGIGTTSGVRGFFFAAPVKDSAGDVSGVIAVKIGLDVIEAEWRLQDPHVVVTDPEGVVFLSTDPAWLYKGMSPLSPDRLDRIQQSRRYADVIPAPLDYALDSDGEVNLMTLPDADGQTNEYLMVSRLLPRADWTVHVLLDTRAMHAQARLTVLAAVLCLAAVLAVVAVIVQRRARLAERFALQEETKVELEHRVRMRTADLARVNTLLATEVAERRLTEVELRRTQSDLVQAGKLAALGQMSAALSHEINQPLAAARNFADSAAILIDRGDPGRAKDNISQILGLIDRMAAIARHLRQVARKPDGLLKDIILADAVAEALQIVGPRLADIAVNVALPADLPRVRGGPVRLQQVLINLFSNAADAVDGVGAGRITVAAFARESRVLLTVQDNGPGVPAAIIDRIFDPFFTTKGVGAGLGLGLSISYNIMKDFGGDLRVANGQGGTGAVFTIDLAIATMPAEATA